MNKVVKADEATFPLSTVLLKMSIKYILYDQGVFFFSKIMVGINSAPKEPRVRNPTSQYLSTRTLIVSPEFYTRICVYHLCNFCLICVLNILT